MSMSIVGSLETLNKGQIALVLGFSILGVVSVVMYVYPLSISLWKESSVLSCHVALRLGCKVKCLRSRD